MKFKNFWNTLRLVSGLTFFCHLTAISAQDKDDLFAEAEAFWDTALKELEGLDAEVWVPKMDQLALDYAEKVDALYEAYPDDSRIWNLVVQSGYSAPMFVTEIKPGITFENRWDKIVSDSKKADEFNAKQEARIYAMLEAEAVPEHVLNGGFGWLLTKTENEFWKSKGSKDLQQKYYDLMHLFWKIMPESDFLRIPIQSYVSMLEQYDPDALPAFKEELKNHPNPLVSGWLEAEAEKKETVKSLANLSFESLTGEPVDLAKMRGKVILIDFWATWCGPCKKEIPNVKAVYNDYHDKGFEVIGISLDYKNAEAKLKEYIEENEMPWPQYYDGKAWQSELVTKYGIQGIPAMFLLDANGNVVSTDARGDSLRMLVSEMLDASDE